ncbi:MAG: folylpolyglutamate synthase/dihydrofolate synthase family protein [Planctomycetota bacterium]
MSNALTASVGPALAGEPFADHDEALAYLGSRTNLERVRQGPGVADAMKLDRMDALMEQLGDVHRGLRLVHIAGSKGKGSASEMIASCLQSSGYVTGLFTSPHLLDVRERIRIGGRLVDEAIFDQGLARVRDAADAIEAEHGACTFFEVITALALLVFAEQAVDVAVLEVGLGGRLDCTNIVDPDVVGLTSIQLEHTDVLGDTIEQIAAEKAGVIKPGVTAVSVPQEAAVLEVFRAQAGSVGAELKVLGEDVVYSRRFEASHDRGPHPKVCVGEEGVGFEHLSVPLLGEHQAENCGLALAVLCELREKGFELSERSVAAGLEQTPRRGRLEQIHDRPRVVVDGAHTPESVRESLRAVGAHMRYDSMVVVFGCARDKDIGGMLSELVRGADKVIFTRSSQNPRAAEPEALAASFAETPDAPMALSFGTLKEAINAAARSAGKQDLILVIGSFYLAGEAQGLFEARRNEGR